jgi:replication-associated recombination protein RarA
MSPRERETMTKNKTVPMKSVNIPSGIFDDAVKKLTDLQKQINLHSKAWSSGKLEAGQILLDLRKAAPHGTWEPQLEKICKAAKIGRTTAHRYMDLAEGKAVFGHETISKNGYALDEIRSYLHKSLRRCDEDAAMRCVVELSLSGKDESTWVLLKDVFPSEDVGLARIGLLAEMDALYKSWKKTKNDLRFHTYRLYLVHAVLLLCRVQKSRLVDNALTAHYNAQQPIVIPEDCKTAAAEAFEKSPKIAVPDYAKDKHTAAGRQKGRTKSAPEGVNHFFDEGAALVNETKQPELQDEYAEPARRALLAKCKGAKPVLDEDDFSYLLSKAS